MWRGLQQVSHMVCARIGQGSPYELTPTDFASGKVRRAPGKRNLLYRLRTYKKVYVRLEDDKTRLAAAEAHSLG